MDNKTIVAIEIASSKIKGAVGTVSPDGRVTVQAVAETPSQGNVRYGRVQNIREVSSAVSDMLRKLEESQAVAPRRIRSLALSLGGRSLAGVPSKAALTFTKECEITANQVERLANEATNDIVGDRCVQAKVPRTYYVNNSSVPRPIGTYGESLRGEFTIVTCAKETRQNIDRLRFEGIEPGNTAVVVLPLAIADFVLTQEEKSVGTVFADFGAETTTVAVYKDGSLAFLCTIPMGSRLISRDLMAALSTTEENAAEIIREYSSKGGNNDKENEIGNYIHARAGEIMANVQHQLEAAGFGKDVVCKAVITGGATNIPDIQEQFEFQTKLKARIAEMPSNVTFCVPNRNNADNIDIVALLAASAPHFLDSCLTNIEITQEEETEDDPVVVVQETVHRHQPQHHVIDDNDDNLLGDDPDDEPQEESNHGGGFRKIFGFGKRTNKKNKPAPIDDFDEEPETDSYVEEKKEGKKPRTEPDEGILDGFGKRIMKIFTEPEHLYDDDEDENTDK